jgi:DNA replication protein DnaC
MARVRALYERLIIELGHRQMNCSAHGSFFEYIYYLPTRSEFHYSACPDCLIRADELGQERKAQAEARLQRRALEQRLAEAALPLRFADRALNDYCTDGEGQSEVFEVARRFVDRFERFRTSGQSLIFAGTPGTGKTLLSTMVLREVCRQGYRVRYTTCYGLISAVRRTWGSEGEGRESDVLDAFATPSLLVIDEIGIQAGTDSEKAILSDVIDRRYSERRPTIFVTNLDADGLHEFMGDRIWDRLIEIVRWVPFSWASYRATARRELVD